jgi:ribose 5-phosphate isomerase B
MKVALGGDHRAVAYKEVVKRLLREMGEEPVDYGANSDAPSDYPDFALPVAKAVGAGRCARGVLICGTGMGMAIAANKVRGVRAAVVHDENTAELSRRHNDANVLCMGSGTTSQDMLERIVRIWMTTPFDGGRHARRVQKIAQIEAEEAAGRGLCPM